MKELEKLNMHVEKSKRYQKKQEKKQKFLLLLLLLNANFKLIFCHQKSHFFSSAISIPFPSLEIVLSFFFFFSLTDNKEKENKKDNYRKEEKNRTKNYERTIILMIAIISFNQTYQNNKLNYVMLYLSKITLKIKGIGIKQVFSTDFQRRYYPSKVIINGNETKPVTHSYNLTRENNIVELIWNSNINNCSWMFGYCPDITEIDLSNFGTSQLVDVSFMFDNCISLTSINLTNFDTSKVTSMKGLFFECFSLTSLNLSHFSTSRVREMSYMFEYCKI